MNVRRQLDSHDVEARGRKGGHEGRRKGEVPRWILQRREIFLILCHKCKRKKLWLYKCAHSSVPNPECFDSDITVVCKGMCGERKKTRTHFWPWCVYAGMQWAVCVCVRGSHACSAQLFSDTGSGDVIVYNAKAFSHTHCPPLWVTDTLMFLPLDHRDVPRPTIVWVPCLWLQSVISLVETNTHSQTR